MRYPHIGNYIAFFSFHRGSALLLALLLSVGGCQSEPNGQAAPAEDEHHHQHGHADHFHDFPTALKEIDEIRAHLAMELKSKHYRHAADELAELREVLVAIPELAGDSDQPEVEWNQVNETCQQLLALCGVWEEQLRGDRNNFSEAERLERGFTELQLLANRETVRIAALEEALRRQDEIAEVPEPAVSDANPKLQVEQ
jgi:hypothetical protein